MCGPPLRLQLDVVADAEFCDELAVVLDVALLDVGEEATTLADEHEQAAARVVILLVDLDVLVSSRMRSVRIATWTSAEPESFVSLPNSLMSSALRSLETAM